MEKKFWSWFLKNNKKFLHLNENEDIVQKDKLQTDLLSNLNDYCKGLFFEIGGLPNGRAALIITAEGNLDLFKNVKELVDCAPKIDNWEIIAFKQPMGSDFKINYEGLELDPNTIWFLPLKNSKEPDSIGLKIGFPEYSENDEKKYLGAIFLIIDTLLGEESNAQNIGYIDIGVLPNQYEDKGYIELVKLPDFIDWKKS